MAKNKNKKIDLFIYGTISSLGIIALLLGTALFSRRITTSMIERFITRPTSMQRADSISLPSYFMLGFESEDDLKVFDTQKAQATRVPENASTGKYSLKVEFPAAQDYPGIYFDLFGSHCLDWSRMKEFSFDVFNSINADGILTVQIRSGREYPKREFKKNYAIPANVWTTVTILKDELQGSLDLDKVSHLTIFMSNPSTTYQLYFDRIKVMKAENAL